MTATWRPSRSPAGSRSGVGGQAAPLTAIAVFAAGSARAGGLFQGDPNSTAAAVLNLVGLLVVASTAAAALGGLAAAAWTRSRRAGDRHRKAPPPRASGRQSDGGWRMNLATLLYGGSATILGAWLVVVFFSL